MVLVFRSFILSLFALSVISVFFFVYESSTNIGHAQVLSSEYKNIAQVLPSPPRPPGLGQPGTGNPNPNPGPGPGNPNPVPPQQQPGGGNQGVGGTFVNPLNFGSLPAFLNAILEAVILIAFPILVLFMVYAGFLFVSAQGNPAKIADARKIFLWTLIGSLLVLGAQALSLAIEATVQQLQP